jgi:hypothetical protein
MFKDDVIRLGSQQSHTPRFKFSTGAGVFRRRPIAVSSSLMESNGSLEA